MCAVTLHKVRHDCKHLFEMQLLPEPGTAVDAVSYDMTPCLVRLPLLTEEAPSLQWFMVRHPHELLQLHDECEVLCPWPGAKRCDVFRFTVGEFREAWRTQYPPLQECTQCRQRVWPVGCSCGHDVSMVRPFDGPEHQQKLLAGECADFALTDEAAAAAQKGGEG